MKEEDYSANKMRYHGAQSKNEMILACQDEHNFVSEVKNA
jgi:hypothetical protein